MITVAKWGPIQSGDQGRRCFNGNGESLLKLEPLEPVLVLSSHLDDAVLSCGHFLYANPLTTVVTVLAGAPDTNHEGYNSKTTGKPYAPDAISVRRDEDRQALDYLSATPVWLDFPDHQYLPVDRRPTPAEVAPLLREAVAAAEPSAVFLPMGLANPDHVLTHDAGLAVRAAMVEDGGDLLWFCYEDAGYKHLPGLLAWRVSKLFRSGLWPTPAVVPVEPDMAAKRTAISLYASQIGPLERDHLLSERLDANVPEQFWRLDPPPPGWERLTSSDDLDARRTD